jgi:membrane-bound serine protease (ClpP class)
LPDIRRGASLLLLAFAGVAESQEAPARRVFITDVVGAIGVATQRQIARAIELTGTERGEALVIRLDTPGGLVSSTREIIQEMLASPVPIIVYVAPSGARAASAGTFIVYASHVAAMAPGTNLGAATPIQLGGPSAAPEQTPSDPNAEGKQAGPEAAERKAMNDAVALLRSLAQLRGRNTEFADKAVLEAATLTATEALADRVVEIVAPDIDEVLSQAHGRSVSVAGVQRELLTRGAEQVVIETDWRTRLLAVITDPNVAFLLLMIGVYGLLLEFWNPGALIPGVIGAISIILALMALAALPVHFGALALLLLGIGLMVGEAFTPGIGILGGGGLVAFVAGAIFLFEGRDAGISIRVSWPVIAGVAATSALLIFGVVGAALRARRRPSVTGGEELLGMRATVVEWEGNGGLVRVHGEIWKARSNHELKLTSEARVVGRDGLTLLVEP